MLCSVSTVEHDGSYKRRRASTPTDFGRTSRWTVAADKMRQGINIERPRIPC